MSVEINLRLTNPKNLIQQKMIILGDGTHALSLNCRFARKPKWRPPWWLITQQLKIGKTYANSLVLRFGFSLTGGSKHCRKIVFPTIRISLAKRPGGDISRCFWFFLAIVGFLFSEYSPEIEERVLLSACPSQGVLLEAFARDTHQINC